MAEQTNVRLHRVGKWSLLAHNVESQTVQELQFIDVVASAMGSGCPCGRAREATTPGLIGRRGIPIGRIVRAHFNDAGTTTW